MNTQNKLAAAVAATAPALAADESAFFVKAGHDVASAVSNLSDLRIAIAAHLRKCVTFAAWEGAREAFMAGAVSAGYTPGNKGSAAALWQDIARRSGVEKPRAESADAQRKAEERAIPEGATVEGALREAADAAKRGDTATARKASALAERIEKAANAAARKASHDAVKAQRDRIAESVKILADAANVAALTKLADYAASLIPKAPTSTLPPVPPKAPSKGARKLQAAH